MQIHSAHGYLLSSFLSPARNKRTDNYSCSLQNRVRLLKEIFAAVRASVGANFPISVKINSADFQHGGFTEAEAVQVAQELEALKVDLIEISGGTAENIAFFRTRNKTGKTITEGRVSTRAREGYFLEFVENISKALKITPLMVTGGFRSGECGNGICN